MVDLEYVRFVKHVIGILYHEDELTEEKLKQLLDFENTFQRGTQSKKRKYQARTKETVLSLMLSD